jgi:hypothetical protein
MNTDRRKNNYNIFFTSIFILLFILLLINKLMLISIDNRLEEIDKKIDQYFAPIENIPLPIWEGDSYLNMQE